VSLQALPIRLLKGVHDGDTFTEAPDEEIVKGYEYAKGQHVLIDPKEIDELKLEAKHTIDMVRFVDKDEIPASGRSLITPYRMDEADEGETGKVALWSTHHGRAGSPRRYQGAQKRIDAFHPSLCR